MNTGNDVSGKTIKVVRIIARLNIGGPSIHTVILSKALNGGSYATRLVVGRVSDSEGDMMYLAKAAGVEPVVIPEMEREISLKKDVLAFIKLVSLLKKEKPDIVHTHTAKAGALGRLAAVFAGVPIRIHTFHGHVFDGYFSPLKAKLFVMVERFLALFTTRVIVVSEQVRDEVIGRLKITSPDKCSVIGLGLELDKFLNSGRSMGSLRKRFNIDDNTLLVGIVGRLVPIKNHKMFLDAAASLLKNVTDVKVRFFVVGDGELRKELEGYTAKLGIKEYVYFTGWVKDLETVYPDLDILVITSLNEGTPVSIIEAMASRRAVVSTDVGGVRDIVNDGVNGILVRSGDVSGLAKRLEVLLKDAQKRALMGAQGSDFVKNKYSSDRLIEDIKTLYESCVNSTRK